MADDITWSDAEAAVGRDDESADWKLVPGTHAGNLPPTAGALKRVLESRAIRDIMSRYSECDATAIQEQARYRRAHWWLVRLSISTAATGVLAFGLHLFLRYQHDLQLVLILLHFALFVATVWLAGRLSRKGSRGKWLRARGEAELLRVTLFDRVLASRETPQEGELPLLPLQLAYFRRYQFDVQLRYFQKRGGELLREAGFSSVWTGMAFALAFSAFLVALISLAHVAPEYGLDMPGAIMALVRPGFIEEIGFWCFLTLALTARYAVGLGWRDGSEDERNGERYRRMADNLGFLRREGYERVREAAEAGDRATVEKYARLVQDLLKAEQTQWISYNDLTASQDAVLAFGSAAGLADIFADRFEKGTEASRFGAAPPTATEKDMPSPPRETEAAV